MTSTTAVSGPPGTPVVAYEIKPSNGGAFRPRGSVIVGGKVYVADSEGARVAVLDLARGRDAQLTFIPIAPENPSVPLKARPQPTAVGALPDGTLLVTDAANGTIWRVSTDGSVLGTFPEQLDRLRSKLIVAGGHLGRRRPGVRHRRRRSADQGLLRVGQLPARVRQGRVLPGRVLVPQRRDGRRRRPRGGGRFEQQARPAHGSRRVGAGGHHRGRAPPSPFRCRERWPATDSAVYTSSTPSDRRSSSSTATTGTCSRTGRTPTPATVLNLPEGIAIDDRVVVVSDGGNQRLLVYTY